jgi:ABC-type glutathione transport system ATPase component
MKLRRSKTASRIRHDDATKPLLAVKDLSLEFRTRSGTVRALENVSLEVR